MNRYYLKKEIAYGRADGDFFILPKHFEISSSGGFNSKVYISELDDHVVIYPLYWYTEEEYLKTLSEETT